MNKTNAKRRSKRPECGANAPTFLSAVYKRGTQAKKRQAGAPQYGRSMIEMLGVLAIIGVLSVGGIMGYSKAMTRYRINKTIELITYIAGNVRTTFASQGNYEGVSDTDVWRKAHIFPDDYREEDWSWISDISYEKKNSADTQWKAFQIYDDGNPSEEMCIELLTHDWRNAQVKMIKVYSYGYSSQSYDKYVIPPVKLDDAVKICDHSNEPTNHDYEFHYYFDIDTSDPMYKNLIDETTEALAGW